MIENKRKTCSRVQEIVKKASENNLTVKFVNDAGYAQGVAAKVKLAWAGIAWWDWFKQRNITSIVLLDSIQDPHNLGACMRTACAFGVDMMLIPARRAASLNATAMKVASGAGAWLPVFSANNLLSCVKVLQDMGFWVVCCSEHASANLTKLQHDKLLLIVGNEQKGIRSSLLQQADYPAKLPTKGAIQSLNVSVALGVALSVLL